MTSSLAPPSPAAAREVTLLEPSGVGWWVMTGIEIAKLRAQLRVRVVFAAALLGPILFAAALAVQSTVPADTLFGRWVHDSGWAIPLVVLGFCTQWVIPILIGIVAGDTAAGEDHRGTWSLILTRSRSRGEVLAGKVLAVTLYAVLIVVVLGVASTVAGVVASGSSPLEGLSGQLLSSSAALRVVVEAWALTLAPTLAVTGIAVLASVVSRNSWVGVIAPTVAVLACTLIGMLSAVDPIRPLLPTTGFDAWHGLARPHPYFGPMWESLAVSAGWLVVTLVASFFCMARRDVVDR